MAPKYLTALATLLSLTLTTSATNTTTSPSSSSSSPSTNTPSFSAAAAASASATSLSSLALPGGTASPPLTLFMYADPDCGDSSSDDETLTNVLPLSYNVTRPQYPFWGFVLTRNLTSNEVLTFYSSDNTTRDACGEAVGNLTSSDGAGAGICWPVVGGATCYNLTKD